MRAALMLLPVLILLLVYPAFSAEIRVPVDYPSINSAVKNANPGDVIIIESGLYSGQDNINVEIDKPLRIVGYGATVESGGYFGFLINSSSITIEGINFEGRAIGTKGFVTASRIKITNITATRGDAIYLSGRMSDVEIEGVNLNLSNYGVGILLDGYFENVTIRNGVIKGPYWAGIQLKRSDATYYHKNVTIENVAIIGSNYDGIYANNVTDLAIKNSVISESSDDGIEGYGLKGSLIIEGIAISHSSDYGIYLQGNADLLFRNNSVNGANKGVFISGLRSNHSEISNISAIYAVKVQNSNFRNLKITNITATRGDAVYLSGRMSDVEIEGVNLNLSNYGVGILLDGYFENVTIRNGVIKDPYWAGIQLKRSNAAYYHKNVTIENVAIIGSNYDGIYANNVTDLAIKNSAISESGDDGIEGYGLKGSLIIERTTVSNSSDYGIYLQGNADLLFRNNSVVESANGFYAYQLTSAEITGSIFYNNTNYNMKLSGIDTSVVLYNTFSNSTKSIVLSNTFARIHYNNLLNSTIAIANYQSLEINATYNYWGFCEENATLMADKIDSLIYDDDESSNGRVIFHPWLCSPVNVSLPVSLAKPDIVLENVTFSFSGILGDALTVNALLRNAGGDSGAFKVALIRNDTILSEKSIPGLLANESVRVSLNWVVDKTDEINLAVKADCYDQVDESNESNNEYFFTIHVGRPDFVLNNLTWSFDGRSLLLTANVSNIGASSKLKVPVEIMINGTNFTKVLRNYIYELHTNGSKGISFMVSNPPSGKLSVKALVDPDDIVNELNESNNVMQISLNIRYPDLIVRSLEMDRQPVYGGEVVNLTAEVENVGSLVNNAHICVEFYANTTKISSVCRYLSLAENETANFTAKYSVIPGNYTLRALVDPGNDILEENESNNELGIDVSVPMPDFVILSATPLYDLNTSGLRVPFEVRVKNLGADYYGTVEVQLYKDDQEFLSISHGEYYFYGMKNGETKSLWLYYPVTPGNHTVKIIVDPGNKIWEKNESNNAVNFEIFTPYPDLTVKDVAVPENVSAYEKYNISVTIENSGKGGVVFVPGLKFTQYGKLVSTLPVVKIRINDRDYLRYPLEKIKAGETRILNVSWIPGGIEGNMSVEASIIYDLDGNSSNNRIVRNFTLNVVKPDIVIEGVSFPETMADREYVSFLINVSNLGKGVTRPFTIAFPLPGVGILRVDPIKPGETKVVRANWIARPGNYTISIIADNYDLVAEENESNNVYNISFTVEPVEDFDLFFTPALATPNSTVIVKGYVINSGSKDVNLTLNTTSQFPCSVEPSSLYLLPGEKGDVSVYVNIPDNESFVNQYVPVVITANSSSKSENFTATIHIKDGTEINDLRPFGKIANRNVTVSWRTLANSSTEVYFREVGKGNYTLVEGEWGSYHKVTLRNLSYDKCYEYYVVSSNKYGSSQSNVMQFCVVKDVSFLEDSYSFNVRKDYDQHFQIWIINYDSSQHKVKASVINPYENVLAVGFVGVGGDYEAVINPHASVPLDLAIHAQRAEPGNYTLFLNLTSDSASDEVPLYINVYKPDYNFSLVEVSSDPYTLAKKFKVVNHGDAITDLSVSVVGENRGKVKIEPEIARGYLRENGELYFELTPILYENFSKINVTLVVSGGDKQIIRNVSFTVPQGKKVFKVIPGSLSIEFLEAYDSDENPYTNPQGLINSTRIDNLSGFFADIALRVIKNGKPAANAEVTLFLDNGTGTWNFTGKTDVYGIVHFLITDVSGTYKYWAEAMNGKVRTEIREFTVADVPQLVVLRDINWQKIYIDDYPISGNSTTLRPMKDLKFTFNTSALGEPALFLRERLLGSVIWVSGKMNGSTIEFSPPPLYPGIYEVSAMVLNGNVVHASERKTFIIVDSRASNSNLSALMPVNLNDELGALSYLPVDLNFTTDGNKVVYPVYMLDINQTHWKIGLIVYSTKDIQDLMWVNSSAGNISYTVSIKKNYTLIEISVPKGYFTIGFEDFAKLNIKSIGKKALDIVNSPEFSFVVTQGEFKHVKVANAFYAAENGYRAYQAWKKGDHGGVAVNGFSALSSGINFVSNLGAAAPLISSQFAAGSIVLDCGLKVTKWYNNQLSEAIAFAENPFGYDSVGISLTGCINHPRDQGYFSLPYYPPASLSGKAKAKIGYIGGAKVPHYSNVLLNGHEIERHEHETPDGNYYTSFDSSNLNFGSKPGSSAINEIAYQTFRINPGILILTAGIQILIEKYPNSEEFVVAENYSDALNAVSQRSETGYVDFDIKEDDLILPSNATAGKPVQIGIKVNNGGLRISGFARVVFEINGSVVGEGYTGLIPPFENSTVWTIWVPEEPGRYLLKVTVNPDRSTREFTYSNNEVTAYIDVLSGNVRPVANFTVNPSKPAAGEEVLFNASLSYDPDGVIVSYTWDFGDGNTTVTSEPVVKHVYTSPGTYTVSLTVTDDLLASSTVFKTLVVFQKGDISRDGSVNIADVTMVAYMLVGKIEPDLAADFNGNGRVDIGDLAKIAYYVLGKISEL